MKNKTKSSVTAVIYARYSSHAQNDASIEQQVEKCREYAARTGAQILSVYEDRAISGRSDRRPQFQRMMREAANGTFNAVIAWKSNRMGRNMLEAMQNDSRLLALGIRCLYVEEDFGDTAAGRFALRNMMNVNQFYSENMAEDIRRGMADNARQCKVNGLVPLGYRRGEDGRYAIDEAAADVVRDIFRRVSMGESMASIGDDLNARRIRTSSGKAWGKSSFHSLLRNDRYIGTYRYGDVVIENGIPPIIDRDLFYQVQEKLRRRSEVKGRRRENSEYMLTGKLFCGLCGEPMVGYCGTGKSGAVHHYYICRGRHNGTCKKENIRRDRAEQMVASALQMYVLTDEVIDWVCDQVVELQKRILAESDLPRLESELADTRRGIDNIMHAIESGVFSPTVQSRLSALEADERDLTAQISQQRALIPTATPDQVRFFMEQYRHGNINDPDFRRALFDGFLARAILFDDRMRIVFNHTPDHNTIDIPTSIAFNPEPTDGFGLGSQWSTITVRDEHLATIYLIDDLFVLESPIYRK